MQTSPNPTHRPMNWPLGAFRQETCSASWGEHSPHVRGGVGRCRRAGRRPPSGDSNRRWGGPGDVYIAQTLFLYRLTGTRQPAILCLLRACAFVLRCFGTAWRSGEEVTTAPLPQTWIYQEMGLGHSITRYFAHLIDRSTASSWSDWGATCQQGCAHHPRCPPWQARAWQRQEGAVSMYVGY